MNIDNHILKLLASTPEGSRAVTIGDFAREFGVSHAVVLTAARRLVDNGLATPAMASVHGVSTLRGLLPVSPAQPAPEPN